MFKILDMRKLFSKFHIQTQDQKEVIFEKLNTLPKVNLQFILDRLDSLSIPVTTENKKYTLSILLEKDYLKVICIDPVLNSQDATKGILDIEFHFFFNRLNVEFFIVLDRESNKYSNVLQMFYSQNFFQFVHIIEPLMRCQNKENKLQLTHTLEIRYRQGTETHGIIDVNVWAKSTKHYLKMCLEEYDMKTLKNYVDHLEEVEDKDEYLIHKSLLAITKEGIYEHFYLLVHNLETLKFGSQEVQDINGNDRPDYIMSR